MMITVTSISRRSRIPAILLAASYSFLVIMLVVHHHHPRAAQSGITNPRPVETGHHSSPDCPITHHAQQAFLAAPSTGGFNLDIVFREEGIVLPPSPGVHASPHALSVRGPPLSA